MKTNDYSSSSAAAAGAASVFFDGAELTQSTLTGRSQSVAPVGTFDPKATFAIPSSQAARDPLLSFVIAAR